MRYALTLALILVILASQAAQALALEAQTVLEGWVMIPAVEGRGEGSLINVTITITYPGHGNVKIKTFIGEGGVGSTTKASMTMAVKTGSLLAGVDWRLLDADITIKVRDNVEGPSGGFAISLLTYLLLVYQRNIGLRDYAITGAISPEGLSSKVGGVDIKCQLAQKGGYTLVLPASNVEDLTPNCVNRVPVAGIVEALEVVKGMPRLSVNVMYELPGGFSLTMREAALHFINETSRIRNSVPEGYELPEVPAVNISLVLSIIDVNPYASASMAFTGYVRAVQSYYYYMIERQGLQWAAEEVSRVEGELGKVKNMLDSMERRGSIYYVEFLATAYTRLADANASLAIAREQVLGGGSVEEAASYLGLASARLESIRYWVKTAEAVKEERPIIDERDVERAASIFGDYVKVSASYAEALIDYVINVYRPLNSAALKSQLNTVKDIVKAARSEEAKGNYVAALGFYREAFSKSLYLYWLFMRPDNITQEVADRYRRELLTVQALLTSRVVLRGLVSGLAPAYSGYGEFRYARGEYLDAIRLLEDAAASTILWSTLTLSPPVASGWTLQNRAPPSGEAAAPGFRVPSLDYYMLTASIALASMFVGLLLALLASRRLLLSP